MDRPPKLVSADFSCPGRIRSLDIEELPWLDERGKTVGKPSSRRRRCSRSFKFKYTREPIVTIISVENGTAFGLSMALPSPNDWMLSTVMFVTVVMLKYMSVSRNTWRPTRDLDIFMFGRSFARVTRSTTVSKATEEAKLIGAHDTISCIWQFEPKGVAGPVMALYWVATAI